MTKIQKVQKRIFDIIVSSAGLLVLWPVILITWWIAGRETHSTGFFIQERVGRNAEVFNVIKLRTMKVTQTGGTITARNDARITPWGAFFRRWKLDELPQLWNVLKGDMSFVGPRPDVPGYLDMLKGADKILWSLRPGITGPASLKYKDEEDILEKIEDAKEYNDSVIWPDKVKINIAYLDDWSLINDINFIIKTIR
jgi:lipopolysaccharide/colanic/teichoic acid biosynthesis glycosyltransferase